MLMTTLTETVTYWWHLILRETQALPPTVGCSVNHQSLYFPRQLYGADGSVSPLRLCQLTGEVHFTKHIPSFRYSKYSFQQLHPRAMVSDFHKS